MNLGKLRFRKCLFLLTIVSQLSKCLKFMTFREGCFIYAEYIQVLGEALESLSPSVLQKMKKDNIGQLDDYDAPFCEQQYTWVLLYLFVQIQII